MKKVVVALLFLSLLGISVFAQGSKKTRPRVVKSPVPTPTPKEKPKSPELKNDTEKEKKRPVLVDGSTRPSYIPPPSPEG